MDQQPEIPNFETGQTPEIEPVFPESKEAEPDRNPERQPRGAERAPRPETKKPGQGSSLPPVQTPVVTQDDDDDTKSDDEQTKVVITTPMIAEDLDVIEMEWVDKARQIIKDNKDDPFTQEQAMEQLQIDYLRKRYGKEIKSQSSA